LKFIPLDFGRNTPLFGNILGHYIVYRTFSQEGNAWNL